jgi:hypothetical protein
MDKISHHVCNPASCDICVYRYKGHFAAFSVPQNLMHAAEQDIAYIDSVVMGRVMGSEEDSGSGGNSGLTQESADVLAWHNGRTHAPGWDRPCGTPDQPQQCGAGKPWLTRQATAPVGVLDIYKSYVIVKYKFKAEGDEMPDDERKEVFRAAVSRWREQTCIILKEEANAPEPYLLIGNFDVNSCWVEGLGYQQGEIKINLGWCNSVRYVGNVVHEIGHALGMNHEHKRPDAGAVYHGHGPFLKFQWENIKEDWRSQMTGDEESYTGSANDGAGDPQVGYSPYDFESIMHYATNGADEATGWFTTNPSSGVNLVGQREHLSIGDLEQIMDMYQCLERKPCPDNSAHVTDADSCDCNAGYFGSITTQDEGATYEGTCATAACPEHSTGDSVVSGCTCEGGYSGTITAALSDTGYEGTCSQFSGAALLAPNHLLVLLATFGLLRHTLS